MGKGEGRKKNGGKVKEHVDKYKDTGPVSPTAPKKKKSKKK